MKKIIIVFTLVSLIHDGFSQIVIGDGTVLTSGSTIIVSNSSFINDGSTSWNESSVLYLNGTGILQTSNPIEIANLRLNGTYDLMGSIQIPGSLDLLNGILTPNGDSQLIITPLAEINSQNEAFVNGKLYHMGPGDKFFPIGKNGTYTPVTLSDVVGEPDLLIGLEAFNQHLDVNSLPAGIVGASTQWYWEISTAGDFSGSVIQLPVTDEDVTSIASDEDVTILQVNADVSEITDLGSNLSPDLLSITSESPATGPYLLLGFMSHTDNMPVIHNIITPNEQDGKNDQLYIENIESFASENQVILLDRWGTEICRIKNFRNDGSGTDGCDLARLPAGNYICVLQYGENELPPVMVTVIK